MEFTQDQIEMDGFQIKAAPVDDWRSYDERNPVPGYFQFDWLSARHPDLYHTFAQSTKGLMKVVNRLVDLSGLEVIDVGAGTGHSSAGAAEKAKAVIAVDAYESVAIFGKNWMKQAGLKNITYIRGDRSSLPFANNSFDACISSWAELNTSEAYRVLRPDGYLIFLGAPPEALCGELTATLADEYPDLITEIAPDAVFDAACPADDIILQDVFFSGLPGPCTVHRHDFTEICDYGDFREAAAIFGRLYGPKARKYMLDRQQSSFAWRLRIEVIRVKKSSGQRASS